MTSPSKQRNQTFAADGIRAHEIQPGEKLATIRITTQGAALRCLIPGCSFVIEIAAASRGVLESECKAYYSDHRKHRHPEYVGRSYFDFVLGPDWPRGCDGE
jgi:hypothetical protein